MNREEELKILNSVSKVLEDACKETPIALYTYITKEIDITALNEFMFSRIEDYIHSQPGRELEKIALDDEFKLMLTFYGEAWLMGIWYERKRREEEDVTGQHDKAV